MLLTDHPSCIKEMKDNQTLDAFIQMQCKYKRCKFEGALTTVPRRQTTACLALIDSPQFSPSIWTSIFSQNIKLWFLQCTLHTMKHKERCARSAVYFWAPQVTRHAPMHRLTVLTERKLSCHNTWVFEKSHLVKQVVSVVKFLIGGTH